MVSDYVIGQLVFSKSGRDKGRLFVVTYIEGEYLYLVDGKLRKIQTPKKKKKKHVQKTNHVVETIKEKIQEEGKLNDIDVQKALDQYIEASSK